MMKMAGFNSFSRVAALDLQTSVFPSEAHSSSLALMFSGWVLGSKRTTFLAMGLIHLCFEVSAACTSAWGEATPPWHPLPGDTWVALSERRVGCPRLCAHKEEKVNLSL